jgi:glutaconyl-CoA/methylmalonyl-CoA decarboxylase subunit gamma
MKIRVSIDNQVYDVEVGDLQARPILASIDGETFEVWPEVSSAVAPATAAATLRPAPVPTPAPKVQPVTSTPTVRTAPEGSQDKNSAVTAPIPGVIQKVAVKEGDTVAVAQELFILEAMKMKNSIKATRAGKVAGIYVNVGDTVSHGQVLLKFAE